MEQPFPLLNKDIREYDKNHKNNDCNEKILKPERHVKERMEEHIVKYPK